MVKNRMNTVLFAILCLKRDSRHQSIYSILSLLQIKLQSVTTHHSLTDLIINPDDRIDKDITLED